MKTKMQKYKVEEIEETSNGAAWETWSQCETIAEAKSDAAEKLAFGDAAELEGMNCQAWSDPPSGYKVVAHYSNDDEHIRILQRL